MASFLDFCEKNDVPVDCITTHQYAGDPIGGVEDRGEELDEERSAAEAEVWPFEWDEGVLTLKACLGVNDVYGFVIRY